MKAIFICRTCQDINKQRLGTKGFEVRETEFYSFTDAYFHIRDTDSSRMEHAHTVDIVIKEDE